MYFALHDTSEFKPAAFQVLGRVCGLWRQGSSAESEHWLLLASNIPPPSYLKFPSSTTLLYLLHRTYCYLNYLFAYTCYLSPFWKFPESRDFIFFTNVSSAPRHCLAQKRLDGCAVNEWMSKWILPPALSPEEQEEHLRLVKSQKMQDTGQQRGKGIFTE